MKLNDILNYEKTLAGPLFESVEYPWEALDVLGEYILRLGRTLKKELYEEADEGIWIAKSAAVDKSARLKAPIIIGEKSEIGGYAYLRGAVLIGNGCVVGNSAEIKNAVLFDGASLPHCNYVGASILGYKAKLGAGAVISSLFSDRSEVECYLGSKKVKSGRKSLGALVGDFAEIGCSSVVSPGTVISRSAKIKPLTRVRGFIPEGVFYSSGESIISDIL